MTDVAEIARKLTEAQLGWLETIAEQPGGLLSPMNVEVGHGGALAPGIRKGLWEKHNGFYRITPLGLAVRDHLTRKDHA